jgi:prepilin-type N-terminal cleavage/methylation domain-containing protein
VNIASVFRKSKDLPGFTLLEVMAAVAVLGIAMVAIHYGQAQSIRAMARNKDSTLGTMLAWEKMGETLRNRTEDMPQPGEEREGNFEPPYDQFHWVLRVESNVNFPDLLQEVYLTVSWDTEETEAKKKKSASLEQKGGNKVEVCMFLANIQ